MRRLVRIFLMTLLSAVALPVAALSGPAAPISPPAQDGGKAPVSCRPPPGPAVLTANQRNLAAMVAVRSDLCAGRGGEDAPGAPLAAAVGRYLTPPAETAGAAAGAGAGGATGKTAGGAK